MCQENYSEYLKEKKCNLKDIIYLNYICLGCIKFRVFQSWLEVFFWQIQISGCSGDERYVELSEWYW